MQAAGTVVGILRHWIPVLGSQVFPFKFCDQGGAWRAGVSALGRRAGWRTCPQGCRLAVARGQQLRVWLLTAAYGCSPVPAQHCCQHFQHVTGTGGWQERSFSLSRGVRPWYLFLGDVWRAARGGRRKPFLTGSHLHAHSCDQRGWRRFPK